MVQGQQWYVGVNIILQVPIKHSTLADLWQLANKEWGTKSSEMEIHPDQSRISVQAVYKMLQSYDVSRNFLSVLAHTYDDVKYIPHPFPCTITVAIADDNEWDGNTMALSDLTAWPHLWDKDRKVIHPKELVSCDHFKHFGMSGKVLLQVEPDGQAPPMTEDLQLSLISKASAEDGINVIHAPITKGQNQEQEEVLVNDCDKVGQNTLTPPSHTVLNITSGVVSWGESAEFITLYNDVQDPILRQSYNGCKYVMMWDEFEHDEVN